MSASTQVSQKKKVDQAVVAIRKVTGEAAKTRKSALKFLSEIGVTFPDKKNAKTPVRKKHVG